MLRDSELECIYSVLKVLQTFYGATLLFSESKRFTFSQAFFMISNMKNIVSELRYVLDDIDEYALPVVDHLHMNIDHRIQPSERMLMAALLKPVLKDTLPVTQR